MAYASLKEILEDDREMLTRIRKTLDVESSPVPLQELVLAAFADQLVRRSVVELLLLVPERKRTSVLTTLSDGNREEVQEILVAYTENYDQFIKRVLLAQLAEVQAKLSK